MAAVAPRQGEPHTGPVVVPILSGTAASPGLGRPLLKRCLHFAASEELESDYAPAQGNSFGPIAKLPYARALAQCSHCPRYKLPRRSFALEQSDHAGRPPSRGTAPVSPLVRGVPLLRVFRSAEPETD